MVERKSSTTAVAIAIGIIGGAGQQASAAALYWDNGNSTSVWGTAANWATAASGGVNPAAAPGVNDDAIFNATAVSTAQVVTMATVTVKSLQFNSSASTGVQLQAPNLGFTIGTGGILLESGAGAVTIGGAATQVTMKLNGNQSWINNSSSLLTIANTTQQAVTGSPNVLTIQGSGSGGVTFTGAIGGTGTSATSLVIDTTGGATVLTTAGTYTGGTTIQQGTLKLNGNALGGIANTLTMNGGFLRANVATTGNVTIGNLTGAGGTILNDGAGTATLVIGTTDTGGGNFQGVIENGTGTVALTKNGVAEITLSGTNTYTGETKINAGKLTVNGAIGSGVGANTVTVSNTATLGGTGTIATAANKSVNIAAGGKFAPGTGFGLTLGSGELDISLAVNAAATGSMLFTLGAPASSSKATLNTGLLDIGTGKLAFDDFVFTTTTGFSANATYTLFAANSLVAGNTLASVGTLTGTVGGYAATISNPSAGNIVLTVVPEPATLGVLGIAGLALARRRQRCR